MTSRHLHSPDDAIDGVAPDHPARRRRPRRRRALAAALVPLVVAPVFAALGATTELDTGIDWPDRGQSTTDVLAMR